MSKTVMGNYINPKDEPAFPCSVETLLTQKGMTLRDYFAAQAMAARMIAVGAHTHRTAQEADECDAECAAAAYRKADAMLKERAK